MSGKFETFTGTRGKHYFRLRAGNGIPVLASQGYQDKRGCTNGIKSVQKHSKNADNFERKTAKNGCLYFNLRAANGQIVAKSQMYKSRSGMENGIKSIMKNAPDAEVVAVEK